MPQYELSTQEEKIFEKQGFYVKKIIRLRRYFSHIALLFFGSLFITSFAFSFGLILMMVGAGLFAIFPGDPEFASFIDILFLILNGGIFFLVFVPDYFQFLKFHTIFFVTKEKFLGKKDIEKSKQKNFLSLDSSKNKYLKWGDELLKHKKTWKSYFQTVIFPILMALMVMFGVIWVYDSLFFSHSLRNIFYFYGCVSVFTIGTPIIRKVLDMVNPRYVYATLGEEIQSLTPKMKQTSKEIQKNFEGDMNFSVLSDGFDSLSSTFSEIVTLVMRLEKIETKANKGNLFDSEKYIHSLREDICTPLKQLKSFLEKQRDQLVHSQEELKKVRIGTGSSSNYREESELSSRRSDPLIRELTENIEKLDTMIEKLA